MKPKYIVMNENELKETVEKGYHKMGLNCAQISLMVLSKEFDLMLDPQIYHAAIGMNGTGNYGSQCGLVEGPVLFLGILGSAKGMENAEIKMLCRRFAEIFEKTFGSLLCRILRPEGFKPENPHGLCNDLTCRTIRFSLNFVLDLDLELK